MSSTIKLAQELSKLSQQLINSSLTQDERDNIEARIADIEYQLDQEYNHHHHEDEY